MEYLTDNFRRFFKNINVGVTTERVAAREYEAIKGLLEDPRGRASELSPQCFLQGSYRQQTAIHDLNDIDIVALCGLWQPGASGGTGRSWSRDDIFRTIAAPIEADARYRGKVRYGPTSMCVKVQLEIKVEILPVVFKSGNNDPQSEPFRLYRPQTGNWEDGYARLHQQWLSWKNKDEKTQGNFIPAIKVLKHVRTIFGIPAVSFHIESLLFRLPDSVFVGAPVEYIPRIFATIAARTADEWYAAAVRTPCEDRDIFVPGEWGRNEWSLFHDLAGKLSTVAGLARAATTASGAAELWQIVLGKNFFPT